MHIEHSLNAPGNCNPLQQTCVADSILNAHFTDEDTTAQGGEETCSDTELEMVQPWLEGTQHGPGASPACEWTIIEDFLLLGIEFIWS